MIGAAIEVHRQLGPGLLESTYEACLLYELLERGLHVERQKRLPVQYRGVRIDEGEADDEEREGRGDGPPGGQRGRSRLDWTSNVMQPLKAHVRNGRLLLDEPTDLPEGAEVELFLVDDGEFEPEERARLIQAIEEGTEDIERGDYVDGMEFANQLLTKREAASR